MKYCVRFYHKNNSLQWQFTLESDDIDGDEARLLDLYNEQWPREEDRAEVVLISPLNDWLIALEYRGQQYREMLDVTSKTPKKEVD